MYIVGIWICTNQPSSIGPRDYPGPDGVHNPQGPPGPPGVSVVVLTEVQYNGRLCTQRNYTAATVCSNTGWGQLINMTDLGNTCPENLTVIVQLSAHVQAVPHQSILTFSHFMNLPSTPWYVLQNVCVQYWYTQIGKRVLHMYIYRYGHSGLNFDRNGHGCTTKQVWIVPWLVQSCRERWCLLWYSQRCTSGSNYCDHDGPWFTTTLSKETVTTLKWGGALTMTPKTSEWSNWRSTSTEYKTVVAVFSSVHVCTRLVLKQHHSRMIFILYWFHLL